MNLQELQIGQQISKAKYTHNLESIIRRHGWQILGTGLEAVVARHPDKPYALKIFEADSAYGKFVDLVQSHSSNPHFPRFSRYVKPIPGIPKFKYVRMEILHHIPNESLERNYMPYLCAIEQIIMRHSVNHEGLFWNHSFRMNLRGFEDEIECAKQSPTEWQEAVELVVAAMPKLGITQLDLHANNMMMRGKTLVITDPYYVA